MGRSKSFYTSKTFWKISEYEYATYNATTGKLEGTASGSNTIDTTTHFVDTNVVNKKGFTLPSTGGQGMVALVAAGICLMTLMAALMALYMKKHRNA